MRVEKGRMIEEGRMVDKKICLKEWWKMKRMVEEKKNGGREREWWKRKRMVGEGERVGKEKKSDWDQSWNLKRGVEMAKRIC